jgi:ribonuclease P protein component
MLARENRVRAADDFRATVRRGRRFATPHTIVYVVANTQTESPRFGFIVTKAVGGAVGRNLIRRRLRGISHDIIAAHAATGSLAHSNIVVRVLPRGLESSWPSLHAEVSHAVSRSVEQL